QALLLRCPHRPVAAAGEGDHLELRALGACRAAGGEQHGRRDDSWIHGLSSVSVCRQYRAQRRSRGSSASRRRSATRLIAPTARSSAIPGNRLIQYWPESRKLNPFAIRRPSDGWVIGRPRPRNDSVASSVIAAATCTAARTISGGRQL